MLSYDESKKTLTVTYNGNPSITNVVLSNEGTVVKVYYDCILCTVTFEFNDETINLDNTQVVKYGATLQKPEISSENKYFYN